MRFSRKKNFAAFLLIFVSSLNGACQAPRGGAETAVNAPPASAGSQNYKWTQVTGKAEYKVGYNYPLYSIKNKLWAFHAEEIFSSADDGKTWARSNLPSIRRDVYQAQYAKFGD